MRAMKFLATFAMLLLFVWIGLGCSNADNLNTPDLPDPGDNPNSGDPMDPDIPVPFRDTTFGTIVDFAFEKDGDMVISDADAGILLFDSFGVFKRNISLGQTVWTGMVDVGPGWLDSGKAVIVTGPPIGCSWKNFYDDAFVQEGGSFPDCPT